MKHISLPLLAVLSSVGCGLSPINKAPGPEDSGAHTGSYLMVGDVRISPAEVEFGAVSLNTAATSEVVLTNLGDFSTNLSTAFLDGDAAFSLSATTPAELVPGADVVVTVTFTPVAEQPYEGTLNLLLDGEADFTILPIAGNGGEDVGGGDDTGGGGGGGDGGRLSLDTTSVSFGKVGIGSIQSETVVVTNTGDADVLISDVQTTASGVIEGDIGVPVVLSPDESEELLVRFSPQTESTVSGTLTLINDSGTNPTISVNGTGFQDCSICSPILSVLTGGSSTTTMDQFKATPTNNPDVQTLILSNTGDVALTVSNITIKNDSDTPSKIICGTNGTYSLVGASFPLVIGAYSSGSVSVQFKYTGATFAVCGEATLDPTANKITIESDSATGSSVQIGLGGYYSPI